jgi:hypothetical protein
MKPLSSCTSSLDEGVQMSFSLLQEMVVDAEGGKVVRPHEPVNGGDHHAIDIRK